MLKLRIREYTPMGVKGRILPAIDINYGAQLNGEASLTFSLSWADSVNMDSPFVVRVEYSTDGNKFEAIPNNDFFVVYQDSGDDADAAKIVKYTGRSYLPWLLAKTYIHWTSSAKNGERTINVNPGHLMQSLTTESKARGWGTQFNRDFTNVVDSNGVNWVAGDVFRQAWRLLTPLSDILNEMVESELCDWSTSGLTFKMYRPDTLGTDKSEIVLGGPRMERVPVEVDATDIFTNLTVVPEKARNWLYLSNAGQEGNVTKFGRLEATMTQSGIASHVEATKLAQSTMKKGRTIVRQESYEWTPTDEDIIPWDNFNIGDMITAKSRGGSAIRRVVGLVVDETGGTTIVRVVVGEKSKTSGARLRDRLQSVAVGDFVGGSGSGFPTIPAPLLSPPAKPLGLVVSSNESYWDGATPRANVALNWADVTEDEEGAEIDIAQYEVWSRLPGEDGSVNALTNISEIIMENWAPGVERLVYVRAQSTNGDWSEFSDEIEVTPEFPTALTPKAPGKPTEVSNTGHFTPVGPMATVTISWSPTTEATDDLPIEIISYTIYNGTQVIGTSAGTTFTTTIPSGTITNFRVSAVSMYGVSSDPSEATPITGADPSTESRVPSDPVLTTSLGTVAATWDGVTTPAYSIYGFSVGVYARLEGESTWIPQGARLTSAGSQSVTIGDVGDEVEVQFRLFDPLNRSVGTSATKSIVVSGVDVPDITGELENWIIANGGSHVHVGEVEPSNPNENDLWFVTDSNGDIETIKIYNGSSFVVYSIIADSILVANSITGSSLNVEEIWADVAWLNEVSAGVIAADEISPIGELLNIYANEAVQIIVGRQDTQDTAIEDIQEGVSTAISEAEAAALEATQAKQAAINAESAALLAQALADDVELALQEHQTVYIIDEFGAVIASIDQTNQLLMRSNYIAMVQNGLEVTRWEGNRMIVREIIVQEARIGNHQFTQYNPVGQPKRTIIRPIT